MMLSNLKEISAIKKLAEISGLKNKKICPFKTVKNIFS